LKRREEKRRERGKEKRTKVIEEKRGEEKSYSSTPLLGLHGKLQVSFTCIRWE